jgi:hypothetical protein
MRPTIAYLAQGKVRLKIGNEPLRTVESPYANQIREREVRAQQRNSWKAQGGGFLSGAMLWGQRGAAQGPTPVIVTSISGSADKGRIIYSLESGSLCALLAAENFGGEERRLWNNNNFKLQHVRACSRTGDLAFSATHANGTANIGVMFKDENSVKELTEGDSVDTSPQWAPGKPRKLVFQSAGVGRNRQGHFLALGPFSIQELNLDTAEMNTLLEDAKTDYLAPQITEDGSLYYIRRPYAPTEGLNFWRVIKDFFLFPFRLLYALFQFLNFFSMSFTGKKLSTAGDTRARELDMRQMMIYGNIIRAQQESGDDAPDLVPGSWQLARRSGNGREEILARGVLAYDVAADSTIAYSNGSAVFVISPDGKKERIVSERMIEQVVLLNN